MRTQFQSPYTLRLAQSIPQSRIGAFRGTIPTRELLWRNIVFELKSRPRIPHQILGKLLFYIAFTQNRDVNRLRDSLSGFSEAEMVFHLSLGDAEAAVLR